MCNCGALATELYDAYHFKQDINNLPQNRTDCRCVRDSLFSSCRESLLFISKGSAAAIPWLLPPESSDGRGPAKTGAPPSSKGSSWSWMGRAPQTRFLSLVLKFPLLYLLLCYFHSTFLPIFLTQLTSLFHLKGFVQLLEEIWGERYPLQSRCWDGFIW